MQDVIHVFIWICALGTAVAIPMSLRKSRVACLGWLSVYLLAYWYVSANGRYTHNVSSASSKWMPKHCERTVAAGGREISRLNGLGAFFAPLLWVDRVTLHRPKEASRAQF